MSRRSERFSQRMCSLDAFAAAFDDPSKIAAFSDGGAGVEQMTDALDYDPVAEQADEQTRTEAFWQLYAGAVLRLVVADKLHLLPTLDLIIRNGGNREESLEKMPRATYFRHRDALLDFFVRLWCA